MVDLTVLLIKKALSHVCYKGIKLITSLNIILKCPLTVNSAGTSFLDIKHTDEDKVYFYIFITP